MPMKIIIINGPNLNLTGKRETEIYGSKTFEALMPELKSQFPGFELEYYQSNIEGEIIDKIQQSGFSFSGIILNPGGYSHTSVAIADAISGVETPVVEVHLSNIYKREEFRHVSLTGKNCIGVITGFGMDSYSLALQYFKKHLKL
jgi:3-dehydroquinate dehydratase II